MTVIDRAFSPWQEISWQFLCSYIAQKRIPQALLIIGAKGLGKYQLAQQFAYSLLCLNPKENGLRCGNCNSCHLINAESHPDLILVLPDEDKSTVSIKQIRQLVTNAYLKPQFESYRVAIINPADLMTSSAANAFLKCLEEPTERTIFILVSGKPNKLPATIISRCQKLKMTMTPGNIMYDWLKEQGVNNNQETLLNLVRSSILTVQQLSNEALLKQRQECFSDWMAIAKRNNHPAIISEKWLKLPETELLNWLISWVTDLIKCGYGIRHEQLCNQDIAPALRDIGQPLNIKKLFNFYDLLVVSRQRLGLQINYQMMIEDILVEWQVINEEN